MSEGWWLLLAVVVGGVWVLTELGHLALWLYEKYQHRRARKALEHTRDLLAEMIHPHP